MLLWSKVEPALPKIGFMLGRSSSTLHLPATSSGFLPALLATSFLLYSPEKVLQAQIFDRKPRLRPAYSTPL